MTWLAAAFYDGRSASRHEAQIEIGADARIRVRTAEGLREYALGEVQISPRIGRTPRMARFPDGASCEVADNDAIDAALEGLDAVDAEHGVHQLESRWSVAIIALVAVIGAVWASITFGIPALARQAAMVFPVEADRALGAQSMAILDKSFFKASQLDAARQAQLKSMFARMTQGLDDRHQFQLELRRGGAIGANALALPSGIVVMTDELVALSNRDEELEAVLAHELGHVVNRHSLRMLLQNSAVSLLMIGLIGDLSSASALVAGVPTVLVQAKHSRQFESEADDFAYRWMDRNQVPRKYFGSMLRRLEEKYGRKGKGGAMSWLSSHPTAAERARD